MIITGQEEWNTGEGAMQAAELTASAGALNDVFHYVLDRACTQMTREVNITLKRYGITTRHFLIMVILSKSGNIMQQEVASQLNLNQNAIVQLMDDLADELGLATRRRNPDNRRQHLLALTKKGEKTLHDARSLIESVYDKCLPISATKRREIANMLAQVRCPEPTQG